MFINKKLYQSKNVYYKLWVMTALLMILNSDKYPHPHQLKRLFSYKEVFPFYFRLLYSFLYRENLYYNPACFILQIYIFFFIITNCFIPNISALGENKIQGIIFGLEYMRHKTIKSIGKIDHVLYRKQIFR